MDAAHRGDVERVVAWAPVLAPIQRRGAAALVNACAAPDEDARRMVDALLRAGLPPDTCANGQPGSALYVAMNTARWSTADRLLDAGGTVQGPPAEGNSPLVRTLIRVALDGPLPLLERLLGRVRNEWGMTEPWGAHRFAEAAFQVCEAWLEATPGPAAQRWSEAQRARQHDVLLAFADAGLPLSRAFSRASHRTLLGYAVVLQNVALVDALLERGSPVVARSFEAVGETLDSRGNPNPLRIWVPLAHLAAMTDDRAVVTRLLAHGVPFDGPVLEPYEVGTPLDLAGRRGACHTLIAVEQHVLNEAITGLSRPSVRPRSRL